MNLNQRIELMLRLGEHLRTKDEYLEAIMHRTAFNNQWFTIENQKQAIDAIATFFLDRSQLKAWLKTYSISDSNSPKKVGLVLAGNIPMVGFHDLLSVFLAGHHAIIKLSDKDQFVLPYIIKLLGEWESEAKHYFRFVPQLKDFDAVIATGSNNSSRYFEAYFGKYPHIIRRNRNAIAILTGEESREELHRLGEDIFQYFGLGCRNVSKLYVPKGYDFEPLMEELHRYNSIILNSKYKNNFDYNYSLYILNKVPIINNGCIILAENESLQSRIASLHYEFYDSTVALEKELEHRKDEIQCIVAKNQEGAFSFGQAQQPQLWDYADGVDTMQFLLSI